MEGRTPNNSVAEQHSVFVGPFETQIAPPKYAGAFTDQELSTDQLYSGAAASGQPADARVYFVVAIHRQGRIAKGARPQWTRRP